jgi:hypothetical protein
MAALQIRWVTMPRIAPEGVKVLTGEQASDPESTPVEKAEKPYLVLVGESAAAGGDEFDKVESVILKDERVALGSRAFTCVRISPEDAAEDPILSKAGKEVPRFVLVTADYKAASVLEKNKLSAGALWDGMKGAADKYYTKPLEGAVKGMRDVLIEVDKLYGERKTLTEKLDRLQEKGTAAQKKEVEDKIAALDEKQKKIEERQQEVWNLKAKAA